MKACESEQQQLHGDGLHQEHCVRCSHENLKRRFVDMLESGVGGGHPHTAPTSVTQCGYITSVGDQNYYVTVTATESLLRPDPLLRDRSPS